MAQQTSSQERGHWSSKIGFTIAAVGAAVGLGNVWKFPYIVGESGGAAFIFIYLLCIGFVGFPIILSDWMIGRRARCNPVDAMAKVAVEDKRSSKWGLVGLLAVLTSFLVISFYCVIGGWTIEYVYHGFQGHFDNLTVESSNALYQSMLDSPWHMFITQTIFLSATVSIVALGIGNGIERASKLMMPVLLVILIGLMIYSIQTPGIGKALDFLISPRWDRLTSESVLTALGHAFFTLSLGLGSMMSYGSFLDDNVNLIKTGIVVVIADTSIALAAGIVIFPIVFSNGFDATAGPGLLFKTLPLAFSNMTVGAWFGIPFFILLTFAALTSSISMLEPSVEWIEERFNISRVKTCIAIGLFVWMLGWLTIGSMNFMKDFTLFGKTIFELIDYISATLTLPIVGLFTIIFTGWFMNPEDVKKQLRLGKWGMYSWLAVSRYLAPTAVVIVFLHGIGVFNTIFEMIQ